MEARKIKNNLKVFNFVFSWSSTQNRLELLQWTICNFPNFRVERSKKKKCRFSFIIRPVHTTVAREFSRLNSKWTLANFQLLFSTHFNSLHIQQQHKKTEYWKKFKFLVIEMRKYHVRGRQRRRLDFTQATWTNVSTEVARNGWTKK